MLVYLLHFDKPYKHARHYLGFVEKDVLQRIQKHENGQGARLLDVITKAGIKFKLVRVWDNFTRKDERRLKNQKKSRKLCPICRGEQSEDFELHISNIKESV